MICLIVKTPAALRTTLSLTQTSLSLDEILPSKEGGKENFSSLLYSFHGPLLDYRRPPTPRVILKAPTCFFAYF